MTGGGIQDLLFPWFASVPHIEPIRGALVLISNLLMVAGMIVFARTARKSGLVLPGTAGLRAGALGLALAVSLLLAGPSLLVGARQVISGDVGGMVSFSSSLGDLVYSSGWAGSGRQHLQEGLQPALGLRVGPGPRIVVVGLQ